MNEQVPVSDESLVLFFLPCGTVQSVSFDNTTVNSLSPFCKEYLLYVMFSQRTRAPRSRTQMPRSLASSADARYPSAICS